MGVFVAGESVIQEGCPVSEPMGPTVTEFDIQ